MKAYPFSHKHPTLGTTSQSEGMDLRDYFAIQILPTFLSSVLPEIQKMDAENMRQVRIAVCLAAYKTADDMLEARKQS